MDSETASHVWDLPTFLSHESYRDDDIWRCRYDCEQTPERSVGAYDAKSGKIWSYHEIPYTASRLRHTECAVRTVILSYLKDNGCWDRIPCRGFSHFPILKGWLPMNRIPWILSGWWHMEISIWLWKNGRRGPSKTSMRRVKYIWSYHDIPYTAWD